MPGGRSARTCISGAENPMITSSAVIASSTVSPGFKTMRSGMKTKRRARIAITRGAAASPCRIIGTMTAAAIQPSTVRRPTGLPRKTGVVMVSPVR